MAGYFAEDEWCVEMNVRCNGCFEIYDSEFGLCPFCGCYPGCSAHEVYHISPGTELVGRYIIGNVLGFGGFGITYKGWDKKLETVVAIKEYYPGGIVNRPPGTQDVIVVSSKKKAEFDYGLMRFIDEARNMAQFSSHRNIVNVFEYFEANNTAYIIMEFLDGCTLGQLMEEKGPTLSLDESIEIVLNVAEGLKVVHGKGIIHRDISPDNIYICNNGNIKLIDFGAARFSADHSNNYTIILKPGFAPPEQYEQMSVQGPWTDLYALGATLYYLTTGQKPEESTDRKIKDTLTEPVKINPAIPLHISDAITKAMALEAHMRFDSAESFAMALRGEKRVVSVVKEKKIKKTGQIAGLCAAFALVVAVAVIFGFVIKDSRMIADLDEAAITVWYEDNGNEKEKQIYEEIVEEYCETYDCIQVDLVGIPADEYKSRIREALHNNSAPDVFESSGLSDSDLNYAGELFDVVYPSRAEDSSFFTKLFNKGSRKDCLFLENYEDVFASGKKLPLGFNTSVVYINKSLVSVTDIPEKIVSYDQLQRLIGEDETILVNEELIGDFEQIFDADVSGKIKQGSREMFINGEAPVYFADTSEFFEIRNMISMDKGIPAVVPIKIAEMQISFSSFWSVSQTSSEDENKAAEAFLSFMLSDSAQNKLFSGNSTEKALPVNRSAMKTFADTHKDFDFILKEKNNSIFAGDKDEL